MHLVAFRGEAVSCAGAARGRASFWEENVRGCDSFGGQGANGHTSIRASKGSAVQKEQRDEHGCARRQEIHANDRRMNGTRVRSRNAPMPMLDRRSCRMWMQLDGLSLESVLTVV